MLSGMRGALDLSELELEEVPPQIFEIAGLKVLSRSKRCTFSIGKSDVYNVSHVPTGAHTCWKPHHGAATSHQQAHEPPKVATFWQFAYQST